MEISRCRGPIQYIWIHSYSPMCGIALKRLPFFVLVFLLFFSSIPVVAQDTLSKGTKDGWAIHLGAGFIFGGNIGLLVEKQFLLKEKLRISPFVSAGIAEGSTDSTTLKRYSWLGFSVGANLEYGKNHRLIFGPHFVWQQLFGSTTEVTKEQLPGVSLILGYKGTARFGLIWQIYFGDIYVQDPTIESGKFYHYSHFGGGLGYKF